MQVPHHSLHARQNQANPNHSRPQSKDKGKSVVINQGTSKTMRDGQTRAPRDSENENGGWQ
ncbi:hypothetical protein C2S52_019855 [Perilla frutescens var. hirtella]|nr:hypothetical protein C2S52_019855 [Perilla frutescens var. hirtella]